MNDQTLRLLHELAEKLGTTSEYLWEALLSQAFVSAVTSCAFLVIYIASITSFIKIFAFLSKKAEDDFSFDDAKIGFAIFSVTTSIAIFIAAFFDVQNAINGFLNPEFWAFDYLTHQLK